MTKHMRLELPDETYESLGYLAKLKRRDKKSQVMSLIDEAIAAMIKEEKTNDRP